MPPLPRKSGLLLAAAMLLPPSTSRALDVLFIGNSFTHIPVEQTGPDGLVGMPAIFSRLAAQGGRAVAVSMDAPSGRPLHEALAATPAPVAPRDVVVLQDVSFQTLESDRLPAFHAAIAGLTGRFRDANPGVSILLFETWSYPALLSIGKYGDSLASIQADIRVAYHEAAERNRLAGVVPVGDAFLYAWERGAVSYGDSGGFSLWGTDNYHQSVAGAYLTAVLFYQGILGVEIDDIPTGEGSVAAGLGFTSEQASLLHEIASATAVAAVPEPRAAATVAAAVSLAVVSLGRRRRDRLSD